jgi:hypothetical protein
MLKFFTIDICWFLGSTLLAGAAALTAVMMLD